MQPKVEGPRGIWSTLKEKAHETKEKAKIKMSYGALRLADAIDGSPEARQETDRLRFEMASKRGRTNAYGGRHISTGLSVQSSSSSTSPSGYPAPMPTSQSGSTLSTIQTAQHLPSSSTSYSSGIPQSSSSTPPLPPPPASSLHPYARGTSQTSSPSSSSSPPPRQWSPAPPTPSSRHAPTIVTSPTTIPSGDPRTLITTAEQKLKDACRLQNAALALEAKALLASAADLLREIDDKTWVRYRFASQRCEDISDLISHGIRVSDYKKVCYADIDDHLKLCVPHTASYFDSFERFLIINPLVGKLSNEVFDLLRENQLKNALTHLREKGQFFREEGLYYMHVHCERQLALLSIAMANQGISNVHANRAKAELCQAVKKIGSSDSSAAIKVLNEAIRCETACQIISKGHRIADIETFLNGNTPPKTPDQMIQTFNAIGQPSAPSASGGTRPLPPQKPIPPTPASHSYAPRSFTPSPATRGTPSSSSSPSDNRVFVNRETGEVIVSPTTSDDAISTLASRKALFGGYGGQQIGPISSTSSGISPSSSSLPPSSRLTPKSPSSASTAFHAHPAGRTYLPFSEAYRNPEVEVVRAKYTDYMKVHTAEGMLAAQNLLTDEAELARNAKNAPLTVFFLVSVADHFVNIACINGHSEPLECSVAYYTHAAKILEEIGEKGYAEDFQRCAENSRLLGVGIRQGQKFICDVPFHVPGLIRVDESLYRGYGYRS